MKTVTTKNNPFAAKDIVQSNMHFACKAKKVVKTCAYAHVEINRSCK